MGYMPSFAPKSTWIEMHHVRGRCVSLIPFLYGNFGSMLSATQDPAAAPDGHSSPGEAAGECKSRSLACKDRMPSRSVRLFLMYKGVEEDYLECSDRQGNAGRVCV